MRIAQVTALAALAGTLVATIGCSDLLSPPRGGAGAREVRVELMRLQGAAPAGVSALLLNSPTVLYPWSSDLAIHSLLVPIRQIVLESAEGGGTAVYDCAAASNDGCLVDLAGPALEDLLGAAPVVVRPGTYSQVAVSTCLNEGGYHAFFSASVSLGGTSWVTSSGSVLDSVGPAQPVRLDYSGCTRRYPLAEPLVITDTAGAPVPVRLYFDIRDIAWASLAASETMAGWLPSGCAGIVPGYGVAAAPFVCAGYPDVAATVDTLVPVIERYRFNGGATIGLVFQASTGAFVGGYTRRYFVAGAVSATGFNADTPVEHFSDNGDGTWWLDTWGGSSPGGTPVGHYFHATAFRRSDHNGIATNAAGQTFSYAVVRVE